MCNIVKDQCDRTSMMSNYDDITFLSVSVMFSLTYTSTRLILKYMFLTGDRFNPVTPPNGINRIFLYPTNVTLKFIVN